MQIPDSECASISPVPAYNSDHEQPSSELTEAEQRKYQSQWSQVGPDTFIACGPTQAKLVPGLYSTAHTPNGFVFIKKAHSTKKIIRFDNTSCEDIVKELDTFWASQAKYKQFDVQYKRGILLHGPQGSGKSSIIKLIIQDIIDRKGIALEFNPNTFNFALTQLRAVEGNTPVVVIMEDLDVLFEHNDSSYLLNMLDGSTNTIDNVLFLATTNFIERLEQRTQNRPSRFDRVIEIPVPSIDVRRSYIASLFENAAVEVGGIVLDKWATDTDNLSFAHITEMFLSVELYGKSYEEALKMMHDLGVSKSSDGYKTNAKSKRTVGFQGNAIAASR